MTAYLPVLMQGAGVTILLWIGAAIISFAIGLTTGAVRSKRLRVPGVAPISDMLVILLRGVPLYAQLMIAYFVIPQLTGISLSPFVTGVVTLGLCSGAYASEIIRGAIQAIPAGQWKAAHVLGYSRWHMIRYVILPQALRQALPALINEYSMVLKSTSIVASIGTLELTKVGMNIMYRTFNPLEVCFSIAAIYLTINTIFSTIGGFIEKRYALH
jgi:polar amino acid transport system permease protein